MFVILADTSVYQDRVVGHSGPRGHIHAGEGFDHIQRDDLGAAFGFLLEQLDEFVDGQGFVLEHKFNEAPGTLCVMGVEDGFQAWDAFERHTVSHRARLFVQGVEVVVDVHLHVPVSKDALVGAYVLTRGIDSHLIVVFLHSHLVAHQVLRHRVARRVHMDHAVGVHGVFADGGQFQWRLVRQQAGFLPLDGAALVQLQQAAVGVGLGLGQAAEGVVSAEQLVAQHLDAVLHMALLVAAKAVGHVDLVPIVHRHFDEVGIEFLLVLADEFAHHVLHVVVHHLSVAAAHHLEKLHMTVQKYILLLVGVQVQPPEVRAG